MNNNLVSRFLDEHNYDVRVSGNGRWIDQKCAFDAVCFVADCIMDYIQNGGSQPFQSPDIWKSEYAITNVQNIFCKPDPLRRTTLDEYNKFFRQPMKMLAAAGVLCEDGVVRNTIQFSVANMDILQYIALRERNAFDFLCLYIEKTLKDSGLWDSFETFFDEQTMMLFRTSRTPLPLSALRIPLSIPLWRQAGFLPRYSILWLVSITKKVQPKGKYLHP